MSHYIKVYHEPSAPLATLMRRRSRPVVAGGEVETAVALLLMPVLLMMISGIDVTLPAPLASTGTRELRNGGWASEGAIGASSSSEDSITRRRRGGCGRVNEVGSAGGGGMEMAQEGGSMDRVAAAAAAAAAAAVDDCSGSCRPAILLWLISKKSSSCIFKASEVHSHEHLATMRQFDLGRLQQLHIRGQLLVAATGLKIGDYTITATHNSHRLNQQQLQLQQHSAAAYPFFFELLPPVAAALPLLVFGVSTMLETSAAAIIIAITITTIITTTITIATITIITAIATITITAH
jgi:hypothetical protein